MLAFTSNYMYLDVCDISIFKFLVTFSLNVPEHCKQETKQVNI